MKLILPVLMPLLLSAAACAESESVEADPDEIQAAVSQANEQAAAAREKNGV